MGAAAKTGESLLSAMLARMTSTISGRAQNVLAHRGQRVVEQHHHGLAFGYALPSGLRLFHHFFLLIGLRPIILTAGQLPFLQVDLLVLQRVSQLVRQDRLLNLRLHPVQQVDALGLRIVVGGHLLAQQAEKFGVQIVARRKQPEFFQHQPRLL